MKASQLKDELEESLLRGAELALRECGTTVGGMRYLNENDLMTAMRERAANLAMGLASRVLSESVADSVAFCEAPMGGTLEDVKNDLEGK